MESRLRSGAKRDGPKANPVVPADGVKTRGQKRARGETVEFEFPDVLPDQRRRRIASPGPKSVLEPSPQQRGHPGIHRGKDKPPAPVPAAKPSDVQPEGVQPEQQEAGPSHPAEPLPEHMDKSSRQARAKQSSKADGKPDETGSGDDEQQVLSVAGS